MLIFFMASAGFPGSVSVPNIFLPESRMISEKPGTFLLSAASNPEKVADVLEKFREDGLYPGRTQSNEIFPDETDRIFYEISLSVEDSHVVTNNVKHFPKVPRVVTPSEMLALLRSSGEI